MSEIGDHIRDALTYGTGGYIDHGSDGVKQWVPQGGYGGPRFTTAQEQKLIDAETNARMRELLNQMAHAKATLQAPPPPTIVAKIGSHTDAEMVMEMIRRGYAVMKLPEDGGPPEVLR
jgi:hypothetical protein